MSVTLGDEKQNHKKRGKKTFLPLEVRLRTLWKKSVCAMVTPRLLSTSDKTIIHQNRRKTTKNKSSKKNDLTMYVDLCM